MLCLKCGQSTPEKSAYCRACGTATSAGKVASFGFEMLDVCKVCGENGFGASYCRSCGVTLTAFRSSPAPHATIAVEPDEVDGGQVPEAASGQPASVGTAKADVDVPQFPEAASEKAVSSEAAEADVDVPHFPEASSEKADSSDADEADVDVFKSSEPSSEKAVSAGADKADADVFKFPEPSSAKAVSAGADKSDVDVFKFPEASSEKAASAGAAKADVDVFKFPEPSSAKAASAGAAKADVDEFKFPEPSSVKADSAGAAKAGVEEFKFPDSAPEQPMPETPVNPDSDSTWSPFSSSFPEPSVSTSSSKRTARRQIPKKVWTIIGLLPLIFFAVNLLYGYFQKNDAGHWQGDVYYNSTWRFSFSLPYGWWDSLDVFTAFANFDGYGDAGEMLMAATNGETGSSVLVATGSLGLVDAFSDSEELARKLRTRLVNEGIDVMDTGQERVADRVWQTIDTRMPEGLQRMHLRREGNTVCFIIVLITYGCNSSFYQVTSAFSPYN